MELLELLTQIPAPIVAVAVAILVILTVVVAVKYVQTKQLDGIRADVYQLILEAEHRYKESGQGEQKLKYVVQQARGLLPDWMQIFVTEKFLINLVNEWFLAVKDLLDDGKMNNSSK